jgi:hypothetical protein
MWRPPQRVINSLRKGSAMSSLDADASDLDLTEPRADAGHGLVDSKLDIWLVRSVFTQSLHGCVREPSRMVREARHMNDTSQRVFSSGLPTAPTRSDSTSSERRMKDGGSANSAMPSSRARWSTATGIESSWRLAASAPRRGKANSEAGASSTESRKALRFTSRIGNRCVDVTRVTEQSSSGQ